MEVVPLTPEFAADVRSWRYPAPYDRYDMANADLEGFFAVMRGDELVAFRSFGSDGRVPGWEYDETALDTGGGLRPDLVGAGLGKEVLAVGLAFGRRRFAPLAFRVTVASFNIRALRTVSSVGFLPAGSFISLTGTAFEVLVRPEN